MINDYNVSTFSKDFDKPTWDYMQRNFFGLKIPKEWGGKGFSTHCVSLVIAKLATSSYDANLTSSRVSMLGEEEGNMLLLFLFLLLW